MVQKRPRFSTKAPNSGFVASANDQGDILWRIRAQGLGEIFADQFLDLTAINESFAADRMALSGLRKTAIDKGLNKLLQSERSFLYNAVNAQ